jgi:hypothetical protein
MERSIIMDKNKIEITYRKVPLGLPCTNRRLVEGYVLKNGLVIIESERDLKGRYLGGAGMDGMCLSTGRVFEPVRDAAGDIQAFREVQPDITHEVTRQP